MLSISDITVSLPLVYFNETKTRTTNLMEVKIFLKV